MENIHMGLLDRAAHLTDQLLAANVPEVGAPPAPSVSPPSAPPADGLQPPCQSRKRGRWLPGRAGRRSFPIHGDDPPVAIKVWSDVVQAELWVIIDELPRNEWPTDAPVYRHAEVRLLTGLGPEVLAWAHLVKTLFKARLVGRCTSEDRRLDQRTGTYSRPG
jgi:hypothetical protein